MFGGLFKRNKKDFNEAYLKLEEDRVVEQEKKRRRELGEPIEEEPKYEYIVTDVDESTIKEVNSEETKQPSEEVIEEGDDTYDLTSSKENPVYRSWKSWVFLFFMTMFIFSGFHIYKDHMSRVLNTEIDYSLFSKSDDSDKKDIDEKNEGVDSSGENNVVGEKSDADNNVSKVQVDDNTDTDSIAPSQDIDVANQSGSLSNSLEKIEVDNLASYSEIHRDLIHTTESIREIVQQYITGATQHVNMASVGSKSRVKMQTLRIKINKLPEGKMKDLLENRSNRILAMANNLSSLTKDGAAEDVNTFIDEENRDSNLFIEQLIGELEDDGREYYLEDDIIRFN